MSDLSLTIPEDKLSYSELEIENTNLKKELQTLKYQLSLLSSPLTLTKTDQIQSPSLLIQPQQSKYTQHTPHLFTPYHHLTPDALQRFSRHLILRAVSPHVQNKWLHSRVLIIGAGGLGAPVALYLAAAGIGHMTLIDNDIVDESNLHRQVIHNETTLHQPKIISAAEQCRKINSNLSLQLIKDTFHTGNAIKLGLDHDVIVDCTDNVTARYLTSDTAVYTNRPLISAAVVGTHGQLTTYCYNNGPCYRCINPTPPPPESVQSCADAGVIGALVGVVGSTQALETLKVLAQISLLNMPLVNEPQDVFHHSWPKVIEPNFEPLSKKMLFWNGMNTDIRTATMRSRQESCMCYEFSQRSGSDGKRNSENSPNSQNAEKILSPKIEHKLSDEEIEKLEIELQKRTVEWACELVPKAVHKPPIDGADINAPIEPKFRLDRIEVGLIMSQVDEQLKFVQNNQKIEHEQNEQQNDKQNSLSIYSLSPKVQTQLGNLLYPLLIDVRFIEQFQIVSIPSSIYCENFSLMKNPNILRDLLWEKYYQKYPQHCEENIIELTKFQNEIKLQDGVGQIENESILNKKKRYNGYKLITPPTYKLKQEITNLLNYSSQQEQECILNLNLAPKTVIHSLPELSITSPRSASSSGITPTEKVIFNELESLPVLHTSLLCRRGRWTLMLLDWVAKYIFTTYFKLIELESTNIGSSSSSPTMPISISMSTINLQQTIPTISSTFAYMSSCCGFPPIILSDVFGGLTALTQIYPDFPTY
jgi:molybdopterin/thiamine biosynthesis adenylyltransferase